MRWPPTSATPGRCTGRPDILLMSFHGVPRYTLDKGDPYHCECQKTGRLLAEALGLDASSSAHFQSRFGRTSGCSPTPTRRWKHSAEKA